MSRREGPAFDESAYYDFGPVLSRNGIFNFVVGGRGIGKTYGAKKLAIKNYLKYGDEFIYLRRYKTELSASVKTFFDDVRHEFPEYGFRVANGEFQMTRHPGVAKPEWERMGYYAALSSSQSKKSVSYDRVTYIIFDEFIIEKGAVHYIAEEEQVMLNFYSTVDRNHDKTRVLFLANAVSIMNPYFIAYHIEPDQDTEWITKSKNFIVCHFPDDSHFKNLVAQTRFGQFIAGTTYEEYAVGNRFKDNTPTLIDKKPPDAEYFMSLVNHEGGMSIWAGDDDQWGTGYWCQRKRPRNENLMTTEPGFVSDECSLVVTSDRIMGILRTAFRHGRMRFDSPSTRNRFVSMVSYR